MITPHLYRQFVIETGRIATYPTEAVNPQIMEFSSNGEESQPDDVHAGK